MREALASGAAIDGHGDSAQRSPMIREATLADIPALVALENRCFTSDRLSERSFRHLLKKGNAALLVDTHAGLLRAYVLVLFHRNTSMARMYSFAVDPDHRGRGLAKGVIGEAERVALANQLRSLLESFWPGAAVIFADIASPIGLAFLQRYPTPTSAKRLGEKRLAAFLASHHYSSHNTASELLTKLRSAPSRHAAALEEEAKGELVAHCVSILKTLVARLTTLKRRIEHEVARLPRGRVIMRFPRAGKVNAAQILSELGDDPGRYPSEEFAQLRPRLADSFLSTFSALAMWSAPSLFPDRTCP